jgi:hypothetical protein
MIFFCSLNLSNAPYGVFLLCIHFLIDDINVVSVIEKLSRIRLQSMDEIEG